MMYNENHQKEVEELKLIIQKQAKALRKKAELINQKEEKKKRMKNKIKELKGQSMNIYDQIEVVDPAKYKRMCNNTKLKGSKDMFL